MLSYISILNGHIMLVLAGTELVFFTVTDIGFYFVFVLNTGLTEPRPFLLFAWRHW